MLQAEAHQDLLLVEEKGLQQEQAVHPVRDLQVQLITEATIVEVILTADHHPNLLAEVAADHIAHQAAAVLPPEDHTVVAEAVDARHPAEAAADVVADADKIKKGKIKYKQKSYFSLHS